MPNWCDNTLKLSHTDKIKVDQLESELSKKNDKGHSAATLFEHFRPNPSGEWDYGWSLENWGTKWEASIIDWERFDDENVTVYFETAWGPPIALYDYLTTQDWIIEAFYNEPGMCFAGIYDNGSDDYYEYAELSADEVDEQFPEELNDMYGISDYKREWEEENQEDDDDDLEWPESKEKE